MSLGPKRSSARRPAGPGLDLGPEHGEVDGLGEEPVGAPLQPGLACITAHDHAPDFAWQRNFQVRGDLVEDEAGWALVPHKLVGGFELPPGSALSRYRLNARKMVRFRKIAKREQAKRG